jgi:hypothetical protein
MGIGINTALIFEDGDCVFSFGLVSDGPIWTALNSYWVRITIVRKTAFYARSFLPNVRVSLRALPMR